MGQLGMGVMIGMLGGNEESVNAFKEALNKKIKSVALCGNRKKCAKRQNEVNHVYTN